MAAVNAELLVYPGAEMKARDMAMLLENVTPQVKGRVYGAATTVGTGANVHITAGYVIIKGRLIQIDEGDLAVTFPSSSTAVTRYIQVAIDLGNPSQPVSIEVVENQGADTTDFNMVDGRAYLTIATIRVNSEGITSVALTPLVRTGTDTLEDDILNRVYPVGAIYMSYEKDPGPHTLFGGTWARIQGRTLIGINDTSGSIFGPSESRTGGAVSVSYRPAGTISGTALTIAQMPAHNHGQVTMSGEFYLVNENIAQGGGRTGNRAIVDTTGTITPTSFLTAKATASRTITTPNTYSTSTNTYNNGVLINATHTHTTQGSGSTHTHTFTGTTASISTLPPYLTVYMWRRTA